MSTYYIDPSRGSNGNGTYGSPFNTWTAAWLAAVRESSDILLQKAGTTFVGTINCSKNGASSDAPIIVGVYDPETGERMRGVQGAATVNADGANIGINLWDRLNVRIEGLEIVNALNYGIYSGYTNGTFEEKIDRVTSLQFDNLYIHDLISKSGAYAIWTQGSGNRYTNIRVRRSGGLSHQGSLIAEDLDVAEIDTVDAARDCLALFYTRSNTAIRRCRFDKSGNHFKQALVMGVWTNPVRVTNYVIEDCEFISTSEIEGAGLVSVSSVNGIVFRRNKIIGRKGIYILGTDSAVDVYSNIIVGVNTNNIGIGCDPGATVNVRHNTIVDHLRGIELLGLKGNAYSNIAYCAGAVTPLLAASRSNNFTNLDGDPNLDEWYRPRNPALKRAGIYLGEKDFMGKQFYDTPNIGAVDDEVDPRYLLMDT